MVGDFVFFADEEIAHDGVDPFAGGVGVFDDDVVVGTFGDHVPAVDVDGKFFALAFEMDVEFAFLGGGIDFEVEDFAVIGHFTGEPALDGGGGAGIFDGIDGSFNDVCPAHVCFGMIAQE